MSYKKLAFNNKGERYFGVSTDTKPTENLRVGDFLEDLDTGAVYRWNGSAWTWYESTKELDHNRAMLGLGLSYKTVHRNDVAVGANAVYRFAPGAVNFHHAESRIMKVLGGYTKFEIYRGTNPANLPAVVTTLTSDNQKGLDPADRNAAVTFTYHGDVLDADLAAVLAGGTLVDEDYFFAAPGLGPSGGTPESSALPSGRHCDPNAEYVVVIKPDNGDPISYFYAYFHHEG